MAFFFEGNEPGEACVITYAQLLEQVQKFANGLKSLGVKKGDCVTIYMPMIIEIGIAMLACARIGAVHSVVFGGFAPKELSMRISDAEPKVVVASTCGIEKDRVVPYLPMLDDAIGLASHRPLHVAIHVRDEVAPEAGWCQPASQEVHEDDCAAPEYLPGGHDWHAEPPSP